MSWNYRVVKLVCAASEEPVYQVHEVYYTDGKPDSITTVEVSPSGNDRAEFVRSWEHYQQDISKPVLVFDWDAGKFTGEEPPMMEAE